MLRSYTILHFYDPSVILNILMRWDRKIVWSYDPDHNFDNHAYYVVRNSKEWYK